MTSSNKASVSVLTLIFFIFGAALCSAQYVRVGDYPEPASAVWKNENEYLSSLSGLKSSNGSCSTCKNGAACCDGEVCCGGGSYCCTPGTGCCGGECCSNTTQSCCADPVHGGICCESELTYCCPPAWEMASHCCPRWNVCCKLGRYGCCDPGTGKPIEDMEAELAKYKEKLPEFGAFLPGNIAYSLFVTSGGGPLAVETIDLSSGSRTQADVTGDYNDWGEVQRTFMFDATRTLFYLLQANFTKLETGIVTRDIILWTIDPASAVASAAIVQGAVQEGELDVTGYAVNDGVITMGVQFFEDKSIGYNFYTVDPETAVATLKSSYVSQNDSYVGWFYTISPDGNTVYRLGYEDVIDQENPGLGVTDISGSTATTQWNSNLPIPSGLGFYESLNLNNGAFISLAPSALGDFSVVQWSLNGTSTVLAKLPDAHDTPFFGPVIEWVISNQYGALVVKNSVLSDLDRWTLVLLDLSGSNSYKELDLVPYMLAKLTSAAALGF
eukprot:TRINITY_DN6654_c0_g1_i2.p1 TRINITY_DN6654_c0_g1~~TRINITY_DN6654_c0_g1_i2.p1  ORF type:complete len:507 (-),score=96.94 TRINITY_DN6654_c0_g1_i2:95-1588(-)